MVLVEPQTPFFQVQMWPVRIYYAICVIIYLDEVLSFGGLVLRVIVMGFMGIFMVPDPRSISSRRVRKGARSADDPPFTQRSALVQAQSLHRRMHCAAARRHLTLLASSQEPPPMTAAEQAQMSEYTKPISGVQRVFHLLRRLKRTRCNCTVELGLMSRAGRCRVQIFWSY